ncbi:hypothetical protein ACOHYD_07200 [Desulfobacterota bacterium M19]
MKSYWFILLLFTTISGCLPQAPAVNNGHPVHSVWRGGILNDSSTLTELLNYYKAMSSLPQPGIEVERQLAMKALKQGNKIARLRLALLYMLPADKVHDSGRALAQLEALSGSKLAARPSFAAFIQLLKHNYVLQKDMQLKNIIVKRKLRQAEHKQQELALKLQKNKRKTAALRRQIQQLKDIERIMNNR